MVPVFARDYVVVQNDKCQFIQGLIIGVDENVQILMDSGRIITLNESKISTILTYGINESPFSSKFKVDKDLQSFFRKIKLREDDQVITGMPFQFIEDLVFLLTDEGRVVVLGASEVKNIEALEEAHSFDKLAMKGIDVDFEEKANECDLPARKGIVFLTSTHL